MAEQGAVGVEPGREVSTEVDWDAYEDLFNDGTERIRPATPEIRITSGTSSMKDAGTHGGHFWFSDKEEGGGQEYWEGEIELVPLQSVYGRAVFGKDSNIPLCSAGEDEKPREGSPLWKLKGFEIKGGAKFAVPFQQAPPDCMACPFSQFTLKDGRRSPCRDGYLVLVDRRHPEDGLAQQRFSGTAMKAWREFNKARKSVNRGNRKFGLPMVAYKLIASTKPENRDGNRWHQLVLEWVRLPKADFERYAAMAREFAGAWREQVASYVPEDDGSPEPAVEGGGWGDGKESYARPASAPPDDGAPPAEDEEWADGD